MKIRLALFLLSLLSAANLVGAADLSERDYFMALPEVLSVTRLAQPLNETPGAVTVIDREMIRRSGARSLVEALRLVPGFVIAYKEGAGRPVASYHAEYEDIPRHLQVFVDGRSAYSSLLVGSAMHGMMGIVMEDIERIEVLRGSNSASYGANAFLGVVNVVTRHAVDTLGTMAVLGAGQSGLSEGVVRLGWGDERAAWRLTAASRRDDGFAGLNDSLRLDQLHFRGDLRASAHDELQLTAGLVQHSWGSDGSIREESWRNYYLQAAWTRQLGAEEQFKAHVQFDEERFNDFFPRYRADGIGRRFEIEAQRSYVASKDWRFVWGGQYRHEQVVSTDLFYDEPNQNFDGWRLFGNAEWKPHPQWVVNFGALWEKHSAAGASTAPRLTVNYHVLPGHTLRVGTTAAFKQPTLFELRADWRDTNGVARVVSSGSGRPERVEATEIGYLGEFRALGLMVDFRRFQERVEDLLRYKAPCNGCPNDIVNKDASLQQGWEAQLRWQPLADTQILLNYADLRLMPAPDNSTPWNRLRAPNHVATLAWFQRLPQNFDLSVIYTATGAYYWVRQNDLTPAWQQTDVRLARKFPIGATRAEAALTLRAVNGGHIDYVARGIPPVYLDRRAALSLRLEF